MSTSTGFPRCLQLDGERFVLVQQMQQQRKQLVVGQQLGDLLAVRDLLGLQSGEQDVALDRLEHPPSIHVVQPQTLSPHLTVDPLRHCHEQIELRNAQFVQRQQADQRLLVDLGETHALKRLLAFPDDERPDVSQRKLLRISDLEQVAVDQAAVPRSQPALDVLEKLLLEIMQQVLVGGLVAFAELIQSVIDLEAVDEPAEKV